jgi:hypothetical protein
MILDYYGMKFISIETGKLKRTKKYNERYENLIKYRKICFYKPAKIIFLTWFLFQETHIIIYILQEY